MEKLNYNYPMNEADKKEALTLLREGISRGLITYEHANPLNENCYISSSDIEGLYFPNSSIQFIVHKDYLKFVCLAKVRGKVSAVFEWHGKFESLNPYHTETLESLVYTKEELKAFSVYDEHIAYAKRDLDKLASIKRTHKKDGSDFFELKRNFEGCYSFSLVWSGYPKAVLSCVKINGYSFCLKGEPDKEPSAEEVEALINQERQALRERIKANEERKKRASKIITKIYKLVKPCRDYLSTLEDTEFYTYRDIFKDLLNERVKQ